MRRLLIRPGAIGDLIVSLPALESLKAGYTEVWVSAANVPLIRFADRVRAISATGLDLLELGLESAGLRAALTSFDSIVSWYGTARPEFRDAVRDLPFTFHAALPDGSCHAVDFYLAQVGQPPGAAPRLPVARIAERRIVIHPFSGSPRKNWPLAQFKELARRLAARCWPVAWCAGPEEPLDGAVRFDDLWELARWLSGAALFVGNDSGIAHLAAAAGAPVVALFGPTDARVWAPRGPLVRVLEREALAAIQVEEVMEAVLQCLPCSPGLS